MTTLQDSMKIALTDQGFTGTLNDQMYAWAADNGGLFNTLDDRIRGALLNNGGTSGAMNDLWMQVMIAQGFTTGTLQDRLKLFWESGGSFFLLNAALTNTLVPSKGTLDSFARTSAATVIDFEGLTRYCLAEEARFQGARRVENIISSNNIKDDWTISNVTVTSGIDDPDNGTEAYNCVYGTGGSTSLIITTPNNVDMCNSAYMKLNSTSGSGQIQMQSGGGGVTNITSDLITGEWKRIAVPIEVSLGTAAIIGFKVTGSRIANIDIAFGQMEVVEGQTNQNPGEFVSIDTLSIPYHGANVDGVKYFNTENGNTVVSNVVTETDGTAISDSILKGYLVEEVATNEADTDDPNTQTITVGTGDWTISLKGTASFTLTLGTATGTISDATATEASTAQCNITGAGTIIITLDSGTLDTVPNNGANIIQCENTAYVTSFIVAPGGTTIRTVDVLTYDEPSYLTGSSVFDFVFKCDFELPVAAIDHANNGFIIDLFATSHQASLTFLTSDGKTNAFKTTTAGGAQSAFSNIANAANTVHKIAGRFGQSGGHQFLGIGGAAGVKQTNSNADTNVLDRSSGAKKIYIGCRNDSILQINGYIKNLEIHGRDLTDADCVRITS